MCMDRITINERSIIEVNKKRHPYHSLLHIRGWGCQSLLKSSGKWFCRSIVRIYTKTLQGYRTDRWLQLTSLVTG